MNKTCLSYWFPILEAAGLPVPKTTILKMPEECRKQIWSLFDGDAGQSAAAHKFADEVANAAKEFGFPAFLRTGQFSGKHEWARTCYLPGYESTLSHMVALAEFSEMVDILGLAWDVWVVREMLPTKPIAVLPRYEGFPLVREVRCFIRGGEVVCWHPYWPTEAIAQGGIGDLAAIEAIAYSAHRFDESEFMPLAKRCAEAFKDDDAFSVDLLPTERGWYVTDMAEAYRSYHWPDCSMEAEMRKPTERIQ